MSQIIVIGGGLSGASAANTVLECGANVLLLDKNAFCGGNSVKATSGINGAGTSTQFQAKIADNAEEFYKDIWYSAAGLDKTNAKPYELAKTLAYESGPAVTWLQQKFNLDLSKVSRLGGHSFPRTHRGKEKFPGMTITMTLLEALEEVEKKEPSRCRIVNEATVTRLLTGPDGTGVIGVEYTKGGKTLVEYGGVIIASGGYAADYTDTSLLKKYRPDLMSFPTTNGEHCTGDGIKMAMAIGADVVDMEWVQVHPTGLVHPDDPNAKVKWLAAEALRGVGGIMIDRHGKRFVNELGTRDYVSTEMLKRHEAQGPYRLVINSKGSKEIEWHCHHYVSRKLMKHYTSGTELAKDMKISSSVIEATMKTYSTQGAKGQDEFGKKYFDNIPFTIDDSFYVAFVCPVVHYSMGGLRTN
jgi:flavocytochrome c